MAGRRRSLLCLIAGVWLAASAAAVDIFVRSPQQGVPLFGSVELEVEILSGTPLQEVVVELDGVLVGQRSAPPFRWTVQLGEDNRQKVITIRARSTAGEVAERRVVIPPLTVDQEVDLGLQQLYVTVDRGGRRLLSLDRDVFRLFDDGQRQEIITFERGNVPLSAILLIDSSWSMRGAALATALAGARAFVAGLHQLDRAKVMLFSDRLLAETSFTADPAAIRGALVGAVAAGGTAINDHLFQALSRLEVEQGRRVVILLSDGLDVESVLDTQDLRNAANYTQAQLYWIRTGGGELRRGRNYSAWRDADSHAAELLALAEMVRASGGQILDIDRLENTSAAFSEILAELREQYVFGYYPTVDRNDGSWHRVKVVANSRGAKVRTRAGYFDGRPRPAPP